MLEIKITTQPDRRYRIMVTLMRSDRPRYWSFLCINCGSKICELQNMEVYGAINDFYDPQNLENSGLVRHCRGTQDDGLSCLYSYFFNLH